MSGTSEDSESVVSFENSDLKVEVRVQSPARKTLSIEVGAARVGKAFDLAYRQLQRESRVKGFRPGKAPRKVLERLYGASVPQEVERVLVSETLPDALELAEARPLVEPAVEAEPPTLGEAFRYSAAIESKPEIELPELTGLPAQRPPIDVGEDEVLLELENLRERNAPLIEEPEGTAADEGHFLTIDYVGRVDGEPFEGGSAKGHELELGSDRFVPGFEEQLSGAKSGDDRQVSITFPADYGNEELAGKDAVFDVHVEAVKKRVPPELDDEFAKDVGDFDTLDELRERIRTDLAGQREKAAKASLHKTVIDSLIARTDFEVPPGIIERQLQMQMQSFQREYGAYMPEDAMQSQLARMAEEGRAQAERRVREAFLLEGVVSSENIEISEDEVDERLAELAEGRDMNAQQLKRLATEQGWLDSLRGELREQKALEFLTEAAKIEEVEPTDVSAPTV